jgi:hypothetical protein
MIQPSYLITRHQYARLTICLYDPLVRGSSYIRLGKLSSCERKALLSRAQEENASIPKTPVPAPVPAPAPAPAPAFSAIPKISIANSTPVSASASASVPAKKKVSMRLVMSLNPLRVVPVSKP